jgi:hypothetical protein
VKWNEANDSLHTALYENGQFCIESKSIYNMGAEIIELPEKITNTTFDIELRCNWKNGVNSNAFGLIIPGQFSDTKCRKDELEPRGYIFGISSNGFAGIWYEFKNALGKGYYTLTDWKNMISIKTNSSGQNTIRVQVIDNVITYYVNDMFVSRALYNKFNATEGGLIINEKLDMNNFKDVPLLDKTFKHLGIFSYNKQKIEFDEIKVSKFE